MHQGDSRHSMQREIEHLLAALPADHITTALLDAFHQEAFNLILADEHIERVTSRSLSLSKRCYLFHNWHIIQQSGSMFSALQQRLRDDDVHLSLAKARQHFSRFQSLDVDSFFSMATRVCGSVRWLDPDYQAADAQSFQIWQHHTIVKHPDLLIGLLTLLVHEIYIQAEANLVFMQLNQSSVEIIPPHDPLSAVFAWSQACNRINAKPRIIHLVNALEAYCQTQQLAIQHYELTNLFRAYLDKKWAVMASVSAYIAAHKPTPYLVAKAG